VDETTLQSLEYPAILKELSLSAQTPYGSELASKLYPLTNAEEIDSIFAVVREAIDLVKSSGRALSIGGLVDIRPMLDKLGPPGVYLLCDELIEIKRTLETTLSLKNFASRQFERACPGLGALMSALSDQTGLVAELSRIIDERGMIADDASPELRRVRREINHARSRVRKLVDSFVSGDRFKDFLQEEYVTIRDDRYVVAVKASAQSFVPGVIHGRSASGETCFVEPMEVVELNNKLSILKREETAEEIRILRALSALIAGENDNIKADVDIIASIDLAQAKAELARRLGGAIPIVNPDGRIALKSARHPLLILKELGGGARAVPVDIVMEENTKTLVISGANTGGKTAALKTLGLLTLMAQTGIPIPAGDGSEARVFMDVMADIGDRQNITEALSTFSAHVKRLTGFVSDAGPETLLLIDEIGVGTDPSEGGALALALLETLAEKGAKTVATTHINLIKAHASIDERFMNASVIFDAATLEPSYNLKYGAPGASLGLKIAENLGMPAPVMERARKKLGPGEGAFIESLAALDAEKERLRKVSEELEELEGARRAAVERLRKERAVLIDKARRRIEASAANATQEIKSAVSRVKEREKETEGARPGVAVSRMSEESKGALAKVRSATEGVFREREEKRETFVPGVGDAVIVEGSNVRGAVTKVFVEDEEAEVTSGNVRVRVPWKKLSKKGGSKKGVLKDFKPEAAFTGHDTEAVPFAQSVNIIGERVEDALQILTAFIDSAHVNGIQAIEIIHGKGTGALRSAVREFLSANPFVKSFHQPNLAEGGAGVTIAELK
jgi:DNA mismatch repair protein MutS2